MSHEPDKGQEFDWGLYIAQLERLSCQIVSAIKNEAYDEAKLLASKRLALLSMLVENGGSTRKFPEALIRQACQLAEVEAELSFFLEKEKDLVGANLAIMMTGARANTLYKKNR